jgi:hypothetical protein
MPTGAGLKMRVELAALANKFGIAAPRPVSIPLAPPVACPMLLCGQASSADVDLERMAFAPFCFGLPRPSHVKLLYRHDPATSAGTIEELKYSERGALQVSALVTHELSRRLGGFSIGCWIEKYELVNIDSPAFFARVTSARLEEISLTSEPASPTALVRTRFPGPAHRAYYETMESFVDVIRKFVTVLPQIAALTPQPTEGATVHKAARRGPQIGDIMYGGAVWSDLPARPSSKPRSSFGALADHLRTLEA